MSKCSPIVETKTGNSYYTDDGQFVPAHTLYLVRCACGSRKHDAAVWNADRDRAMRNYERRVSGGTGTSYRTGDTAS